MHIGGSFAYPLQQEPEIALALGPGRDEDSVIGDAFDDLADGASLSTFSVEYWSPSSETRRPRRRLGLTLLDPTTRRPSAFAKPRTRRNPP